MTANNNTAVFQKALGFALQWEGGYSNHHSDKGGATNRGITQATYNEYRSNKELKVQSVRNITTKEVYDIYYSMYWLPGKCNVLPDKLAIVHFDWCVNSGVNRGIKTLQQVIHTPCDGI